jgi:hypothetical protein
MRNWFEAMNTMMQGYGRGFVPMTHTMSGPLFVILSLVSTVLWFLIATFTQALNLTLYAGVYQHLTGIGPALEPPAPPAPARPAPVTTVSAEPEPEQLILPPPSPSEEEPPPAL